jgi:hypothetical protein
MSEWILIRWCIAIPFGLLWVLCMLGHIVSMIRIARRGESTSPIPLIGGISGALAVLICPIAGIWIWFWLPPLLDVGALAVIVGMLYHRNATRAKASKADGTGKT